MCQPYVPLVTPALCGCKERKVREGEPGAVPSRGRGRIWDVLLPSSDAQSPFPPDDRTTALDVFTSITSGAIGTPPPRILAARDHLENGRRR